MPKMKTSLMAIWLMVSAAVSCFSGALPVDPRTFSAQIVEPGGLGSGCFLRLSNSVYLLTVKHVLFWPEVGTNPPVLRAGTAGVQLYATAGATNRSQRAVMLDLVRLMTAGEIRYSTNRDVAIVRVEDCETNDFRLVRVLPGVTFVTPMSGLDVPFEECVGRLKTVDVGADVFMFGYPASLTMGLGGIFGLNEPLLRKGIVAGVSTQSGSIIIDCPSYQGNSGGPVLQVEHPAFGATTYHLIGLVSAFVPFEEEWENKTLQYSHKLKSNSGYTIIEPIDVALDLVWK
jgi:hypothetical protein